MAGEPPSRFALLRAALVSSTADGWNTDRTDGALKSQTRPHFYLIRVDQASQSSMCVCVCVIECARACVCVCLVCYGSESTRVPAGEAGTSGTRRPIKKMYLRT